MMDRYLIRYFLAVVETGSFSRAATSVNVTQPTMSAGIAKLEGQLGTAVFRRNNRRVHLTEAGSKFLPFARRIESEFNRALATIQEVEPVTNLRIGVLNTISSQLVSRSLTAMIQKDPTLRIEIVDGSERELMANVAKNRIDVAVTLIERGGGQFREELLFEEGYSVAMREDPASTSLTTVSAEDIAGRVMIVRRNCEVLPETSRFFTERGVRPFFAYRSAQDDRVMAMVAAGLGLTIVPRSHVTAGVKLVELVGFNLTRKIGLSFSNVAEIEQLRGLSGFQAFVESLIEGGKIAS